MYCYLYVFKQENRRPKISNRISKGISRIESTLNFVSAVTAMRSNIKNYLSAKRKPTTLRGGYSQFPKPRIQGNSGQ